MKKRGRPRKQQNEKIDKPYDNVLLCIINHKMKKSKKVKIIIKYKIYKCINYYKIKNLIYSLFKI